ncbi:NADP-dependent oxidoreductase [Citrobacter freundii]|uniref:NADP-dependent oxidoreductase n=1 Tax=Citrobacter freundii TaxID=546 RepID=A0AA44NFH6_CITFR|nr:aldo/keto reductase [Citrobacter freundii]OYQ91266.1 NADP-dependent oxidoreductase [Citrobacter freundii]OYQ93079.1 NADP-dependent oxidoreductase [Citrobacter freundii]
MEYRYLGRSALKVSPLCLGAMMFGGETDEATSKQIIDRASEQGVNFIDTADVYHAGKSEEIVGRAIASQRDKWVIATKFGFPFAQGVNDQGQSRKWIYQSVDASLRRLGSDYIDILYFHRAIPGLALEESVRAIGDLIRQGKVRYFGVSNFTGWRIAEICRIADLLGIDRPVASEPLYNIVNRTAEVEQLPSAAHYGLGVVPYSPLARGVLSGKYAVDATPPAESRAGRGDLRIQQTELRKESIEIAQKIAAYAAERGTDSIALSLAWVLNNPNVTSTIAGPRTEVHWNSYMNALSLQLTDEDEKFIDSLVPPGHVSTHGYTDPGYPVEGCKAR